MLLAMLRSGNALCSPFISLLLEFTLLFDLCVKDSPTLTPLKSYCEILL